MSDGEVYDAIVVGSGAAGSWAAKELSESGLEVLLLEAGRQVDPAADFPKPKRQGHQMIVGNPIITRGFATVFGGQPIQARCISFTQLTKNFFVSDRQNPYTTPRGRPFNWFRGRQVGGRMYTWGRMVFRMSDLDFKAASRDGHGEDWPIGYEDLAPWYDKVESFLGVYGSTEGHPAVPDGRYVGATSLNEPELEFREQIEERFSDARVMPARYVKHNPKRIPLPILAAQETGRFTLRSDAVVERLEVDPRSGRATGVRFVDRHTRQPQTVRAKVVVLCASAIESVRILLNSASPNHPDGIGNSSGLLGRGLMDHVHVVLSGPHENVEEDTEADADAFDFGKIGGFYLPRFQNLHGSDRRYLRGYAVQGGIGRGYPFWHLTTQGEMLPRPENRVTLEPRKKDAWGIPAVRVDVSYSENENAMIADCLDTMNEMARLTGLEVQATPSGRPLHNLAFKIMRRSLVLDSGATVPGTAVHEVGGAAMGDDPSTSVLNRFNQCWDAENVFVTDGACFPTCGSQNTTLSIMALTARACDFIASEHRAGRF